jgi:hypothetical protein
MRRWLWFAVTVIILALAGWRFGTPYMSVRPTVWCHNDLDHCDPPATCDYIGLQGRVIMGRDNACPFVKLLSWDPSRRLFNLRVPPRPFPPLPPGRVYCNGPAERINPGDKPDQPGCVDDPP